MPSRCWPGCWDRVPSPEGPGPERQAGSPLQKSGGGAGSVQPQVLRERASSTPMGCAAHAQPCRGLPRGPAPRREVGGDLLPRRSRRGVCLQPSCSQPTGQDLNPRGTPTVREAGGWACPVQPRACGVCVLTGCLNLLMFMVNILTAIHI